jgi:hypothetical protein
VFQRICNRHSISRLDLQQPEYEVQSRRRAQVAFLLEKRSKVSILEKKPIGVLLSWVGTHEERLRRKQVEGAPA